MEINYKFQQRAQDGGVWNGLILVCSAENENLEKLRSGK